MHSHEQIQAVRDVLLEHHAFWPGNFDHLARLLLHELDDVEPTQESWVDHTKEFLQREGVIWLPLHGDLPAHIVRRLQEAFPRA